MSLDLDAIDAAEKAMTDAPWAADSLWVTGGPYRLNLCSVRHKPDANGIAILRNAAPALTRRIREQDATIAELRALCGDAAGEAKFNRENGLRLAWRLSEQTVDRLLAASKGEQ